MCERLGANVFLYDVVLRVVGRLCMTWVHFPKHTVHVDLKCLHELLLPLPLGYSNAPSQSLGLVNHQAMKRHGFDLCVFSGRNPPPPVGADFKITRLSMILFLLP